MSESIQLETEIPTAKQLKSVRSKLYYYRKKLSEYAADPEIIKKKPYLYQKAVCREAELVDQIQAMVAKRGSAVSAVEITKIPNKIESLRRAEDNVAPLNDRTIG